jgi:hypothetical protein
LPYNLFNEMDVLDLTVYSKELQDLVGKEPMIWPEEERFCPVENCNWGSHIFRNVRSYRALFLRVQKSHVPIYHCIHVGCTYRATKQNLFKRHILTFHIGLQGCVMSELRVNTKFCSPGGFGMSVPPVHHEQRDLAARSRQQAKTTPLFELSTNYNTRDQKPKF